MIAVGVFDLTGYDGTEIAVLCREHDRKRLCKRIVYTFCFWDPKSIDADHLRMGHTL
jgi:hypothetical protein